MFVHVCEVCVSRGQTSLLIFSHTHTHTYTSMRNAPEDEDEGDGEEHRHVRGHELAEEDGQGLVGQGVEEEKRHQQPVVPADERADLLVVAMAVEMRDEG